MSTVNELAEVGALMGDPTRANMLALLLDGRAHQAGELGSVARVTKSTASWHLARLIDGGLVSSERSGRSRYFRLASPATAHMIETALAVAAARHRRRVRADEALQRARTCYDHLAGRLGVSITDALTRGGCLTLFEDGGEITPKGRSFLAEFGLNLSSLGNSRRIYCRPCLDWTERTPHLAGALGAALAARCFELGWIERVRGTRALNLSRPGLAGFERKFGIRL
jgi:DNA-binding transcriptional ArsR family regulator